MKWSLVKRLFYSKGKSTAYALKRHHYFLIFLRYRWSFALCPHTHEGYVHLHFFASNLLQEQYWHPNFGLTTLSCFGFSSLYEELYGIVVGGAELEWGGGGGGYGLDGWSGLASRSVQEARNMHIATNEIDINFWAFITFCFLSVYILFIY